MAKDIFIIDDKKELVNNLRNLFIDQDYEFKSVSTDDLESVDIKELEDRLAGTVFNEEMIGQIIKETVH